MNESGRSYARSSSLQVTIFTYVLFGVALLTLALFNRELSEDDLLEDNVATLNLEMRYLELLGERGCDSPSDDGFSVFADDATLPFDWDPTRQDLILYPHRDSGDKFLLVPLNCPSSKLMLGLNVQPTVDAINFWRLLNNISILVLLILMACVYLIGRFVVLGTNNIAQTATDIITTGDLTRRIPVLGEWDDLSSMTLVLNRMLGRIDELMQGVKTVSDNIAHDLRTPLARLRSHIEQIDVDNPELDLSELVHELDSVIRMFNSLLRISRIESEQKRSHFSSVCVNKVVDAVHEYYAPLAEDKEITMVAQLSGAKIHGDPDLLFQAVANIIDNAVKYSHARGTVEIRLNADAENCLIEVENTGNKLSEHELMRIFDRFYRADSSRESCGTGLGMSLVKAVVQLHHGKVGVKNGTRGVVVSIQLPLLKALNNKRGSQHSSESAGFR